ncbi:aromatic amino acid transporter [Pasteurella canis]|uniref:Aromatic amino acid permease n=2 Tax=Pasteurella canis TaxID=753 RepID=A0A379EWT6_9PAST|nr:aromatic amino acid transporter [Pasteurella canis]UAY77481.1 aromatic amino acid transporter [Pasteurella canis]UDW83501.1 aromatic amino acid transporter [Pasteurella canis]UEA16570.1 aromatic amino acid transporter [Pasteurella canis]UEC23009.1 aromatic amino acid transporter [Pasteurella canis]SUC10857.1 tyrosine-specific transport protein-2 [Pasteurella canis]
MNKTAGSTLLVSGTMIGAGMLAMPLTSAGIGFSFTLVLLIALWALLTCTALLFVEVYQTTDADAGIGTLAAQYFGRFGRIVATTVLLVFLYALLSAYVTGGGSILASSLPTIVNENTTSKIAIGIFTLFFGAFVIIGTKSVDGINRLLFFIMLTTFVFVLCLMLPKVTVNNLMAMPIDKALLLSASPIFFTSFGFHGSIPSLNHYLQGNVKALRFAILTGSTITLVFYIVWQFSTHGVLSQSHFLDILQQDPTLNGLVNASFQITGSTMLAQAVKIFSALALITSFLGVALGLFECIEDLLKRVFNISGNRMILGILTFLPPLLFAFFYPQGFVLALSYAGQMFAFYAVVLPVALVWKVRQIHPNLPYRVSGGTPVLVLVLILGVAITLIPFITRAGYLPQVVG